MDKSKNHIHFALGVILNLIGAAALGMLLLFVVFMIPVSGIEEHVRNSAELIRNEGTYPKVTKYATSQLDNFTDSIIMLAAADRSEEYLRNRVVHVYYGLIDGLDRAEGLAAHYLDGAEFTREYDYARYWHGYMIFAKPMFSVFDYGTVRLINGIIQVLLVIVICILMFRCGVWQAIIPYIITYLMLMPAALAKSMQFSTCFYLMSLGVLGLTIMRSRVKNFAAASAFVFLNLGILTAYFDLLTYPMAVFGVPAVMYLIVADDSPLRKFIGLVRAGILWCIGYGGMWIMKWILGSLITGTNLFNNASSVFKERTAATSSDGMEHYGIISSVRMNYAAFLKTPVTVVLLIFLVVMTVLILIKLFKRELSLPQVIKKLAPYFILSMAPVVWYIFARNHSAMHYWFTNKACVVTIFSAMCGVTEVIKMTKTSSSCIPRDSESEA